MLCSGVLGESFQTIALLVILRYVELNSDACKVLRGNEWKHQPKFFTYISLSSILFASHQKLHQCSSQLSSVKDWAILTHGFTSVATFGSTVSSEHYHILRKCLPESEEMYNLFTNNFSDTKTPDRRCDRTAVCKKVWSMAGQLNSLIVPMERKIGQQSIFPSVSVLQIDPGSYLLDMRCISGDPCYVIYPPTKESLVELQKMISERQQEHSESDNCPTIQILSRAIPLANGGFKCLLQSQDTHWGPSSGEI